MSASIKAAALIAMLALVATAARSDGIGNSGVLGQGTFGGIGGAISAASVTPPTTGKILLVDGTSHLLQVDGASKICLAGGC